jgi:iron complex transport system substrate-binding protein
MQGGDVKRTGKILSTQPLLILAVVLVAITVVGSAILMSNVVRYDSHVSDPTLTLGDITGLNGTNYPGGDYPNLVDSKIVTGNTYDFACRLSTDADVDNITININITNSAGAVDVGDINLKYCDYHSTNSTSLWGWKTVVLSDSNDTLVGSCPPSWNRTIHASGTDNLNNAFRITYNRAGEYSIFLFASVGYSRPNTSYQGTTVEWIVDALGRNVSIEYPSARIVSTSPSTTELIYALGMENKLVGVSDYCDYPPSVVDAKANMTLTTVGGYYTPDAERIAALDPDIVLIGSDVQAQKDLIPLMESLNITVVALYDSNNISEVFFNIDIVGKVLFCQNKASDLKETMSGIISGIYDKINDIGQKPKVMVTVWLDPIYVAGNDTFTNEIIEIAGGINAFGNMTAFPTVSKEAVVQANPDVIIVAATMMVSDAKSPEDVRNDIMNDSLFKETNAVKNGKVFIVLNQSENAFLRPGIRIVDGAQLLAKMLYPDEMGGTHIQYITNNQYGLYIDSLYKILGLDTWTSIPPEITILNMVTGTPHQQKILVVDVSDPQEYAIVKVSFVWNLTSIFPLIASGTLAGTPEASEFTITFVDIANDVKVSAGDYFLVTSSGGLYPVEFNLLWGSESVKIGTTSWTTF